MTQRRGFRLTLWCAGEGIRGKSDGGFFSSVRTHCLAVLLGIHEHVVPDCLRPHILFQLSLLSGAAASGSCPPWCSQYPQFPQSDNNPSECQVDAVNPGGPPMMHSPFKIASSLTNHANEMTRFGLLRAPGDETKKITRHP